MPMNDTGVVDTQVNDSASNVSDPAQNQAADAASNPDIYDLTDPNRLIRIKGNDKPVKFADHVGGFQKQFTQASQRAAQLERDIKARDAEIARMRSAVSNQSPSQADPSADVLNALKTLPYLSGEKAAEVVSHISSAIQQRDMVLLAALKQMQQMQTVLQGLNQTATDSSFDAKINKWLQEGGYDPGYADLAKEIYLAYEGDDLDTEFPTIFANRVTAIEKLVEAKRAKAANAARRAPFLPGKGGQANPSKPLELKPDASAKEIADQLWGTWNPSET